MKIFIRFSLVFIIVNTLLLSCKKNDEFKYTEALQASSTAVNTLDATSGLTVNGIGDSAAFQVINIEGNSPGIAGYTNNNNDTVSLYVYEGTAYQKWVVAGRSKEYFTIVNKGSGKYLEAKTNGLVAVNQQSGNDAQLWKIVKTSGKAYKILSKLTGLAITSVGTGIILKTYDGSSAQQWGYNLLTNEKSATSFSVSELFQSNMVVQRYKPLQVWGKATAGATVTVKPSWNSSIIKTVADVDGNWKLYIPSAAANNTPQTLTCSANGPKPVKFTNVLIGDVWIGSGQSNMTMPLNKQDDNFGGFHGVYNYQSEIAAADYPDIRMLPIRAIANKTPQEYITNPGTWVVCNPTNAAANNFSATGYYFARKLYTSIPGNVPIGIIISAVGATYVEQWSSKETIAKDPVTQNYYAGRNASSQFYNGMIYPLKNLSIKGFIWYQGESNTSDTPVANYTILNSNMIKDWRILFNQGTLPFYFVQLPPLGTLFADAALYKNSLFREAQMNVRLVEHTGMACLMDLNEPYNIHNIYKKPTGERLALLALANDYAQPVSSVGPQYVSYMQSGDTIGVQFKNADGLTDNGSQKPVYFFVASAADKKFIQAANVVISGSKVYFKVPVKGMKVDAVRYAFTDVSVTHINNAAGLPMEPFRTDNW